MTAGISQRDLAKQLGVSDKTISAYETGRAIPPSSALTKISEITNVSISEIVGIEENKYEKSDKILERLELIEKKLVVMEKILVQFDKNENKK
jgi:transcriptional regulator with XRE-family HTH domain